MKTIVRFLFRRNIQKRDSLKFTSRIQTTLLLSIGISALLMVSISLLFWPLVIVVPLLIPFLVLVSNLFLSPLYEYLKYRLQQKARKHMESHGSLQVIAIAGSYGKTTTKNFLYELLRYNYRTQMIPGNINTPTGIAAWVLKNLEKSTEILLVEMDTYFIGEIRRSCNVCTPNIAIITSIGDQHLERFGTSQKLATAIMEVFTYAKASATCYMFERDVKKAKDLGVSVPRKITRVDEESKISRTNIVSVTAKEDVRMAVSVAKQFDLPGSIIADTLQHLEHPDRRQKSIQLHGYEVIDDSYNISFSTASAAVEELVKQSVSKHKKSLVLTAGIPETGPDNRDANKKYGLLLAKKVDTVIVLDSIYKNELMNDGFIVVEDMTHAWSLIKEKFPTSKHLILVQPELTDLYY